MNMKRPNHHFSPAFISELSQCEIFVFGSNLQGLHGGGAARIAHQSFGAKWGEGDGPTGQCYAIPTMHGGIEAIKPYVEKFITYAKAHPMNRFLLTRIGCGIAGFKDAEIAPLFKEALNIPNIAIPRKWLPYLCIDQTLGLEIPEGREEAPEVITDETLKRLCREHLYEIGAGIGNRLPDITVRYARDTNDFGYTGLENCFFSSDGALYVWETDDKWADCHNQALVEDVFGDECHNRGYAHRVIFAGVSTRLRDSNGEYIYSGDVIEISADGIKTELALSADHGGYRFTLDNHSLPLSACRDKMLTRIGTVFFQLDPCENPVTTVAERAMNFNGQQDTNEQHRLKVLMSKYTPNFDQDIWKYQGLEAIGTEFHWNK